MTHKPGILIGPSAWHDAHVKSIYGHKTYIAWIENETQHAARLSAETLKRAMIAEGTQCRLIEYGPGSFIVTWPIACNMLRQLRRGYR